MKPRFSPRAGSLLAAFSDATRPEDCLRAEIPQRPGPLSSQMLGNPPAWHRAPGAGRWRGPRATVGFSALASGRLRGLSAWRPFLAAPIPRPLVVGGYFFPFPCGFFPPSSGSLRSDVSEPGESDSPSQAARDNLSQPGPPNPARAPLISGARCGLCAGSASVCRRRGLRA